MRISDWSSDVCSSDLDRRFLAMADQCCAGKSGKTALNDPKWRRILWFALIINAAMFGVEIVAGVAADSRALQADALDFLGDSANYGSSLGVAGMVLAGWEGRGGGTRVVRTWEERG